MLRKVFAIILVCFLPSLVFAGPFDNLLNKIKEPTQRVRPATKKVNPALKPGMGISVGSLAMSDFQSRESEGRHYWFVKLGNRSKDSFPKRSLEITAYQYDDKGRKTPAGEAFRNGIEIQPGRSIQLQREFAPIDDIRSITIIATDVGSNKSIKSQRFTVDLRPKPVTGVVGASMEAVFSGIMSVHIKEDSENSLWYAEIRNVGNGQLKFSDYDFHIAPAIRGRKYSSEPWTDVSTFYDQVLEPNESFPIYIATVYDSCYSGDLIQVNVRKLDSGRVINVFKQLERPLFRSSFGPDDIPDEPIRYYDFSIDLPYPPHGHPPFVSRVYASGNLGIKRGSKIYRITFSDCSPGSQAVELPDNLHGSDSLTEALIGDLQYYTYFCGRRQLLQHWGGTIIRPLRDMEKASKIEVN